MANKNTPLGAVPRRDTPPDQLKAFLNQLFQFDAQDLDFGMYQIPHYQAHLEGYQPIEEGFRYKMLS